jgi:hypothetical protein
MTILSKDVNNALVWYPSDKEWRWLDAIGENVIKVNYDFANVPLPAADTLLGWTTTLVEAGGGESTAAATTVAGGKLLLTTDTNENDGLNLQMTGEAFQLTGMKPCYFGIKFQCDVADQDDFLVGLCITDTDLLGAMTDGVYFRKIDGTTNVEFVTEKNSIESSVVVATFAAATDITLEFLFDGITVYAYVNGVLAASALVSGSTFPNDEVLTPSIHFLTGAAVTTDEMAIDWLRVIQCR